MVNFDLKNVLDETSNVLLAGVITSSVWIILSFFLSEEPSVVNGEILPPQATEVVNEHLHRTDLQYNLKVAALEMENQKAAIDFEANEESLLDRPTESGSLGLKLDAEDPAARVQKDLEVHSRTRPLRERPADRIDARLANKQYLREYERAYQKEFVNEFMNNAETAGYEVHLNEDLEVVGLKKIKKSQPVLFSNN